MGAGKCDSGGGGNPAMDYHCIQVESKIFVQLLYIWVIDQVWGQDGWVLAKYTFCVFMDWDRVEVHKLGKKQRGPYPAILTEQAWSIKDFLYGFQGNFSCGTQQVVPSEQDSSIFAVLLNITLFTMHCQYSHRASDVLLIIIWLALWAGKMNWILLCDWLCKRARWSYLGRSGLPAVSHKNNFPNKP